jgi:hypothetical protein
MEASFINPTLILFGAIVFFLAFLLFIFLRVSESRDTVLPNFQPAHSGNGGKSSYERALIQAVLNRNTEGIAEVRDMEILKTLNFYREQYSLVKELIREAKDADTIRNFSIENPPCWEDITIITFADQHDRRWVGTIYDSDELWQDPELIDVFPAAAIADSSTSHL